jgi:SAM-dependent methyltransferase
MGALVKRVTPWSMQLRRMGPFAIQPNSDTRTLEYPWAFHAAPLRAGLRVLEIGGGLSGFQFALARHGCDVVNVDPGLRAAGLGWKCDGESVARFNRMFGTAVELRNTVITEANLAPESFDRAYSISVLEHLPEQDLRDAMTHAYRCLKPGGLFVVTVDLFLNIAPFTSRSANEFGTNVDVKALVELAPFELVEGRRDELCGYPEFSCDAILGRLESYFCGDYPALVQCLVLRKPN